MPTRGKKSNNSENNSELINAENNGEAEKVVKPRKPRSTSKTKKTSKASKTKANEANEANEATETSSASEANNATEAIEVSKPDKVSKARKTSEASQTTKSSKASKTSKESKTSKASRAKGGKGKRVVFITGGTGFIGRRLVKKLLMDKQTEIYLMVRRSSFSKVEQLIASLMIDAPDAPERVHIVTGDLAKPTFLDNVTECEALQERVQEIFHLAANYKLGITKEEAMLANVTGTLHMLDFARGCEKLHCIHYVSTLAVAGDFKGRWHEDMLLADQQFDNHYAYTKFLAEVEVRAVMDELPVAIYRPGIVVGDSTTGEMDKIDGPYYLLVPFLKIQALTGAISPMIPVIFPVAPGGDRIKCHVVPVDYVVNCLDYISRQKGIEGKAFSLTDPKPASMRQFIDIFCDRAGWVKPVFNIQTDPLVWFLRQPGIKQIAQSLEPVTKIPIEMVHYTAYATTYDTSNVQEFLEGSDIVCPPLRSYAAKMLAYARKHFV